MNWLIILSAILAVSYADQEFVTTTISQLSQESVSKSDVSKTESVSNTSTPTSYVDVSQENSVATTVLQSSLETSTSLTPEVTNKLGTLNISVVSNGESATVQQSVESKTDAYVLPTTDATFQGTKDEETTVTSLNGNNEAFLSPVTEAQSINNSNIQESGVNTIENREPSVTSPKPLQNHSESPYNETSSVSVTVVQPNTEKSIAAQTESSPVLSSTSQEPFSSPSIPESHTSTEQIKTKPVLPEVIASTPVIASETSDQTSNTSITNSKSNVTVVSRVPSIDQDATIIYQENKRYENGSYRHGFETSNGIKIEEEGVPHDYNKTDPESGKPVRNIVVRGGYSWTAPSGKHIAIKYYADETGYHAEGDAIPTPPPSPPQILKALAWIRKVQAEKNEKELKMKEEHSENDEKL